MSDDEGATEEREAEPAAEDGADDPGSETDAPDEELVERVADADPEELADEIRALRERREALEDDLAAAEERADDLESRLKRKQADFQNYKKRMERRSEEEARRATEDLLRRLLDVRDNLQRALDQDEDVDIRDGVESTLRQFDRVLADEDVERIEPDPGDDVDPERHEVLSTVASDEPEGAVADLYRPGYELAEKVVRPAQVTVSDGEGDESGEA